MGRLMEKALEKAKLFYIEQLMQSGNYKLKELLTLTISDLKHIYQQEKDFKKKTL